MKIGHTTIQNYWIGSGPTGRYKLAPLLGIVIVETPTYKQPGSHEQRYINALMHDLLIFFSENIIFEPIFVPFSKEE